jgi:predicted alpha/beta superfamily hydrolase
LTAAATDKRGEVATRLANDLPQYHGADPGRSELDGNFRIHRAFDSAFLEPARDILVYLPPDYTTAVDRHYPVLYMQDGQNLFDGATAFVEGNDWHIDETAQRLIEAGAIEPLIIVGIYNTGSHRIDEYTPGYSKRHDRGGKARLYGRFLIEELKPFIDSVYKTRPEREFTGIAGSSLGGLVSFYLGLRRSDVFSRVGLLSPSLWWRRRMMFREVRALRTRPELKIWLDSGTEEGRETLENVRAMKELLVEKGWTLGRDLGYLEAEGAGHDEGAWASRIDKVLRFLFPPE